MIRTQIYLPDSLYRDLVFLAGTKRVSFSSLIRDGAKLVIKKRLGRGPRKFGEGFIGAGEGGPKNLSSKVDYYLYEEGCK